MFFLAPMLYGAGIGALGGLLTGNDPLKTALLGAAGGGIGSAAGFFGGAAGSGVAGANAGASALGSIGNSAGTFGTTLASSTPNILSTSLTPTLATLEGAGAATSPLFGYGANAISPAMSAAESALIPTAAEIGAGFGADTIASMASPSMFSELSKYATVDNLLGAGNIMSKYQPTQRSPAPQGRLTEGKLPQGGLGQGGVEGLLAELEKQRQYQRQPVSLLVG